MSYSDNKDLLSDNMFGIVNRNPLTMHKDLRVYEEINDTILLEKTLRMDIQELELTLTDITLRLHDLKQKLKNITT